MTEVLSGHGGDPRPNIPDNELLQVARHFVDGVVSEARCLAAGPTSRALLQRSSELINACASIRQSFEALLTLCAEDGPSQVPLFVDQVLWEATLGGTVDVASVLIETTQHLKGLSSPSTANIEIAAKASILTLLTGLALHPPRLTTEKPAIQPLLQTTASPETILRFIDDVIQEAGEIMVAAEAQSETPAEPSTSPKPGAMAKMTIVEPVLEVRAVSGDNALPFQVSIGQISAFVDTMLQEAAELSIVRRPTGTGVVAQNVAKYEKLAKEQAQSLAASTVRRARSPPTSPSNTRPSLPSDSATAPSSPGSFSRAASLHENSPYRASRGVEKGNWRPDSEFLACIAGNWTCGKKFGPMVRRHHCRFCGKVFCDECSSSKIQQERACRACYNESQNITPPEPRAASKESCCVM